MIKKIEWDSNFFEKNIYSCDFEDLEKIPKVSNESFFQLKIEEDERKEKEILKKNFVKIDNHIEYEMDIFQYLQNENLNIYLKKVNNMDDYALGEASEIFVGNSRFNFYADRLRVRKFYKKWISQSIVGQFDDECVAFILHDQCIGFTTIKYINSDTIRVGLFGVLSEFQGRGFGKQMLNNLILSLKKKSIKKILIATQGKNVNAQNLYESIGFKRIKTESLYYQKKES